MPASGYCPSARKVREAREFHGNSGQLSWYVSAGQSAFRALDEGGRNGLGRIHTAEVMGSSPVSPTTTKPQVSAASGAVIQWQVCHYCRRSGIGIVLLMTDGPGLEAERAVVTYPAPHGIEAFTLRDGDVVQFGRGSECALRFGYAPTPDHGVPRVAGCLLASNQRVFVESSSQPGHRALAVRSVDGVTVQIPVGEGHSPRENRFDVLVPGDAEPWKLGVTVRPAARAITTTPSLDPPTRRHTLELTDSQRAVLVAYFEPITKGRLEPATHRQVAAALNYHPNTVREVLYDIWALMFAEQIPMPDVADKRIAVVEAARVHGLLATPP